jgi:DNA-binding GntR family transcriptional regulator
LTPPQPVHAPAPDLLVRRTSGDEAAGYIKRLIFEQRLRAGDRVPQDQIARALGISRIPVREALIALEGEGWVTLEVHRGAFVNGFDEDAVRDHYTIFGLIYGLAVQRALARTADHAALANQLEGIVADLGDDDEPVRAERVAFDFHRAIVRAGGSQPIRTNLKNMSGLIPGNFFAEVPGSIAVERRGLTAIGRAIRRNDATSANREYQSMIDQHAELVVELFRRRGFFDHG